MRLRFAFLLAGLLLAPAAARADVRPHALCSDGMVLQQKSKVKVWGKADPGEKVTVTFRGQEKSHPTDDLGNWVVTLDSGEPGGPFPMTIAGKNELKYADVLVGEVWVCSGQSNMEWSIDRCDTTDKEAAFKELHNPMLRCFQVAKTPMSRPITETVGKWVEADPKVVGGWTAVGYFFGRDLNKNLKVPVGLIQSAWGGTRAEAWTSPETLAASETYKAEIDNFLKSAPGDNAQPTKNPNAPSALYNGMIRPLLNYTVKGAVWYQGESNVGKAYLYRELFPMMIENWRKDWKQPLSFHFVQLAPFLPVKQEPGENAWAELREAQLMTLKLPGTGQAVITDLGHEGDIHPTPKRPVGERLALIARAKDYGEKVVYSGPLYKALKVEGSKAVLSFDHVGGGLVAKELVRTDLRKNAKTGQEAAAYRVKQGSDGAALVGFTVAGKDHKFHPAKAEIVGETVVLTSEAVAEPAAVRYGWADHPVCNLFNREGLPASPFRTDTLPGVTMPKR